MAKQKSRFVNAPNTELLAVRQLLREAYGTPDLDVVGMAFCANGWGPVIPEKYFGSENFMKRKNAY